MSRPLNKAERHTIKMTKYKLRLVKNRLTGINIKHNLYSYRTTGKPCSCAICSPGKRKENGTRKKEYKELQFQINK